MAHVEAVSALPAKTAALVDERVRVERYAFSEKEADALDESLMMKAVVGAADYEYAAEMAKTLGGIKRAVEAYYKPHKQQIDRMKRAVLDAEGEDAGKYDVEADRVAQFAAGWARAEKLREAQAKAEAERVAREEAEAKRQADVARLVEAAKRVPDPAVQAAVEAEAQQLAQAPVVPTRPNFSSRIPAVRGFVPTVTRYRAEVDDLMALVKAVAAGEVSIEALQANQPWLNDRATAMKDALKIPGVRVVKDEGTATRS